MVHSISCWEFCRFVGMDRYHRVEKPRNDTPISQNEIRITTQGRMRNYISYGMSLLEVTSLLWFHFGFIVIWHKRALMFCIPCYHALTIAVKCLQFDIIWSGNTGGILPCACICFYLWVVLPFNDCNEQQNCSPACLQLLIAICTLGKW